MHEYTGALGTRNGKTETRARREGLQVFKESSFLVFPHVAPNGRKRMDLMMHDASFHAMKQAREVGVSSPHSVSYWQAHHGNFGLTIGMWVVWQLVCEGENMALDGFWLNMNVNVDVECGEFLQGISDICAQRGENARSDEEQRVVTTIRRWIAQTWQ